MEMIVVSWTDDEGTDRQREFDQDDKSRAQALVVRLQLQGIIPQVTREQTKRRKRDDRDRD